MHHVEAEQPERADADSQEESDVLIDFVPDSSHFARPAKPAAKPLVTRRMVIALGVLAGIAVVFAAIAMKPGPRSVRAAVPQPREVAPVIQSDPTSDKFELFVLPEWVEEDGATKRMK